MAKKKSAKKKTKKSTKSSSKKGAKQATKDKSKKSEKKKEKSQWIYLTGALVLIAVILFAGAIYPTLKQEQQIEDNRYNEFDFIQEAGTGFWYLNAEIDNKPVSILFRHHPSEVDDIYVHSPARKIINHLSRLVYNGEDALLYMAFNPNEDEDILKGIAIASVELGRLLGERFEIYKIPTVGAITEETNSSLAAQVVSCEDVSPSQGVLIIRSGEVDAVHVPSPNCIILEVTSEENAIKVADRFAYDLLGVIVK